MRSARRVVERMPTVPGCWLELRHNPYHSGGAAQTGMRRATSSARATAWSVSVPNGRWGPCSSTDPQGTITQRMDWRCFSKNSIVHSCRIGTESLPPPRPSCLFPVQSLSSLSRSPWGSKGVGSLSFEARAVRKIRFADLALSGIGEVIIKRNPSARRRTPSSNGICAIR